MEQKNIVTHLCSYYINDSFYNLLFKHLSDEGFLNQPYTFANVNQKCKSNDLQGQVSFCFNTIDRFFFFRKHRKVWNDINSFPHLISCDLIHAHSLFSNGYIAYKLWEKKKIPYIITVRYPDVLTFFKYMINLRKIGVKILMHAKAVIFLSPTYQEYTMSYLSKKEQVAIKDKSYIIPIGVDDFWIENRVTNAIHKPRPKSVKLLFVGKVNKNKNLEILIEICKILQKERYKVLLTVAGKIEDCNYYKIFKKYSFVNYVGVCNKYELLKLYRENDIFIMLSHKESFGLVYAEALTQGLPVIYTKGQGFFGQFDENEVGIGVSDKNPREAIKAIHDILENYEEYSQRAIRLCDKFNWNIIVKDLKGIYTRVVF